MEQCCKAKLLATQSALSRVEAENPRSGNAKSRILMSFCWILLIFFPRGFYAFAFPPPSKPLQSWKFPPGPQLWFESDTSAPSSGSRFEYLPQTVLVLFWEVMEPFGCEAASCGSSLVSVWPHLLLITTGSNSTAPAILCSELHLPPYAGWEPTETMSQVTPPASRYFRQALLSELQGKKLIPPLFRPCCQNAGFCQRFAFCFCQLPVFVFKFRLYYYLLSSWEIFW